MKSSQATKGYLECAASGCFAVAVNSDDVYVIYYEYVCIFYDCLTGWISNNRVGNVHSLKNMG